MINSFSKGRFQRGGVGGGKKNKNKNPEIVDAINLNFQLSYVQVTVDIAAVSMENFCYIDSICYKLKYFNRISMILSSICHVNVDHGQQRCHLQFTMVCANTEIGLGLEPENSNIRICITSGAAEIKKSRKRIFIFF